MITVDIARRFGAFSLDVAFEAGAGITALFGRSGAGKSATIGAIAGLTQPERGRVSVNGSVLLDTEAGICLPRHRRRIGLVFQDSLLFPHLNVRHNLLFGRWFSPRGAETVAFDLVVETLGIGPLLGRRPETLSGGERQRVAIGRALLSAPRLLLLDEPLAALDRERKLEILPLIEHLRDRFSIPILYVSHAIEEVARLASQVVLIENGRVVAQGTPGAVFGGASGGEESDRFTRASVLTATVAGEDAAYGLTELRHPAGTIWLAGRGGAAGQAVRVLVKATDVTLATAPPQGLSVRTVLAGRIAAITRGDGPLATIDIALDGDGHLAAFATRRALDDLGLGIGREVFALIKTVALDERMIR